MAAISQYYVNVSLGAIQTLHARFAGELCNILKRRTGDSTLRYRKLIDINNIIGHIIDILYDYVPVGNSTINDATNGLTETELRSLIDYAYRTLNKYNSNIFLPDEPNIYL